MRWLDRRPKARVLHVFNRNVNLLAEDGEILSLATAEIEPGPFSIVVEREANLGQTTERYFEGLGPSTTVVVGASGLRLGQLNVRVGSAECWDPRLSAGLLHRRPVRAELKLIRNLMTLRETEESLWLALHTEEGSLFDRRIRQAWGNMRQGILSENPRLCAQGARIAAGVGSGLTPAGDDFLVGILIGLRTGMADPGPYVENIVMDATPRTNKLSAAWIAAAGRGDVGQVWHDLASAMSEGDQGRIVDTARRVLGLGHTSGADAMSGFVATMEVIDQR